MPNTREKLIELLMQCVPNNLTPQISGNHLTIDIAQGNIADHLIAHGVTVQEWIPVTEMLPEYGQLVIVYSGGVLSPQVYAQHFWRADFNDWVHITHWMPLPEPPEGE